LETTEAITIPSPSPSTLKNKVATPADKEVKGETITTPEDFVIPIMKFNDQQTKKDDVTSRRNSWTL